MNYGNIVEISSVGMSITFDDNLELAKNSYLPDIQLKLKGIILNLSAVILGFRKIEGEKTVYVVMFGNKISTINRSKIRTFINKTLQLNMEKKLNLK